MKKKIFSIIGFAIFVVIVAFNVNISFHSNFLSDIALANIEALAGCESEVDENFGKSVNLKCTNSSGEEYTLEA